MGNVRKEELYCPYEGGDLYGELYLPDPMPAEKVKFIILSHGIFSSYQATGVSAQVLAAHGYGCYCFDFKGCSYSCRSFADAQLEFVEDAVHGFNLDENNIKGVLEFLNENM